MNHADALPNNPGAFDAVVCFSDKQAQLSLRKLETTESRSPAIREDTTVCDFQWEAAGWQLKHLTPYSSQE